MPDGSSTAHLLRPKLVTAISERYRLEFLRKDLLAGLTVAIVALPLSMAIAVASGVSPARGLYTAIVGGFVVSALGGSRFQSEDRPGRSSCSSRPPSPGSASTGSCSRSGCRAPC